MEKIICFCIGNYGKGRIRNMCKLDSVEPSKTDIEAVSLKDKHNLNEIERKTKKKFYCGGQPDSYDVWIKEKELIKLLKQIRKN